MFNVLSRKKFLKQVSTHNPPNSVGDCWSACLSSLCGYEEVQKLDILSDNWWSESVEIAYLKGYRLLEVNTPIQGKFPECLLCILSGESPRNPKFNHSVIGKTKSDGTVEFVFDPHVDDTYIKDVQAITFVIYNK